MGTVRSAATVTFIEPEEDDNNEDGASDNDDSDAEYRERPQQVMQSLASMPVIRCRTETLGLLKRIPSNEMRRKTGDFAQAASMMARMNRVRAATMEAERKQTEDLQKEVERASHMKARDSLAATHVAIQAGFAFSKARLFKQALILDVGTTMTKIRWSNAAGLANEARTGELSTLLITSKREDREKEVFMQPINKHPVLLTMDFGGDPCMVSAMISGLFGSLHKCPGVFVACRQTMALLASERKTGVIIDIGSRTSLVVPIHEGLVIHHAVRHCNHICGEAVDKFILSLMEADLAGDDNPLARAREIKERHCHTPHSWNWAVNRNEEGYGETAEIELEKKGKPSGEKVIIPYEVLVSGGEMYLRPTLANEALEGEEAKGIAEIVSESLMACDADIRLLLARNIFTTGKATQFEGFNERLAAELKGWLPASCWDVIVRPTVGLAEGESSITGAIRLAEMESFPHNLYSKEEWNDWQDESRQERQAMWKRLWARFCF